MNVAHVHQPDRNCTCEFYASSGMREDKEKNGKQDGASGSESEENGGKQCVCVCVS